jgi:hypothetical protein
VSTTTDTATATCGAGEIAVGGGGLADSMRTLRGSFPSNAAGQPVTSGVSPTSWTVVFTQSGSQTAYVVCAANIDD